jgi:hypothetical protein
MNLETFISTIKSLNKDSSKIDYIKSQYRSIELSVDDLIYKVLPNISSEYRILDMIKYFKLNFNSYNHLIGLINLFDSEYRKMDVINTLILNLTADQLIEVCTCFDSAYRKLDILKIYKTVINKYQDLIKVIFLFVNDYRILDVIQLLNVSMTKQQSIELCGYLGCDYRRIDLIKYHLNWYTYKDIINILNYIEDDNRKLDVIKLLKGRKHMNNSMTLQDVFNLLDIIKLDTTKLLIMEHFIESISPDLIEELIFKVSDNNSIFSIITMFKDRLQDIDVLSLLQYVKEDNDEYKLLILNHIIKKVKPNRYSECIEYFNTNDGRYKAVMLLNMKDIYITNNDITKLLELFNGNYKYKVLKKKIQDSDINSDILECLSLLDSDISRLKIVNILIDNNVEITNNNLIIALISFTSDDKDRYKMKTIMLYLEHNQIPEEELNELIRCIDNPQYIGYILEYQYGYNMEQINDKLQLLGYDIITDKDTINDIDIDESSSEEDIIINTIIEIPYDDIQLDNMINDMIRHYFNNGIIYYNRVTDKITNCSGQVPSLRLILSNCISS